MKTTISKVDEAGRVERSVEVDELQLPTNEGRVCETCGGNGIDPDQPDTEDLCKECPECKGTGTLPSVPPTGMGQPPIDEAKADAIADAVLAARSFTSEQAAAIKRYYRVLEKIREDRQSLNDRKTAAKAALQEEYPDADVPSLMVAYTVYINAETEASASKQMERVADTVKNVAGIYQPSLWR